MPLFASDVKAWLFDLDGVLTPTALLHRAAWKATFDPVLAEHGAPEFTDQDYLAQVDGKPRQDGARDLLQAKGITPTAELIDSIARAKDKAFAEVLRRDGIEAYPDARDLLQRLRSMGTPCAVVSSSKNCEEVVRAAGLSGLLDARVDGVTAAQEHLPGKPAPAMFQAGARALKVSPASCAVVEDALSGVMAGRGGHFGLVVGVDRVGGSHGRALTENGADVVVTALSELGL
jgi:beta-phosphoglucomutase family hydrolase